ncbi:MAG: DUF4126 family protein [Blastocatellia bacterium]|nr:DUF4126 family protein [Blastocatellia bacterium]
MNSTVILAVVIIGLSAGLRTLTAPAIVAWCAYLGFINLDATPFSFISSTVAVAILSLLALGEYVADLLPSTPNRTAALGLIARVVTGSFSAACLLAATGNSFAFGILGGVAAICGAFAGYETRVRLVKALRVHDAFIALPENLVAIGMSLCAIFLISSR